MLVLIDCQCIVKELGFLVVYVNSFDVVSDCDFCVEFFVVVFLVMVYFSCLVEEVIVWVFEEFGFVWFSDCCVMGSSLMFQKKNFDVFELVWGKIGWVFGYLQGLLIMIKGFFFVYNKDFQEDKEVLFDVFCIICDCVEVMVILFEEGFDFRVECFNEVVEQDFFNVMDVVDYLVFCGVLFCEVY